MNSQPGFWASLDWDNWLYGLFAAVIGGGSGAVVSGLVVGAMDPTKTFAIGTLKSLTLMFSVFVVQGVLSMFMYLKQNSLPTVKTVTTTEKIEAQANPPAIVTTTVEKTEVK